MLRVVIAVVAGYCLLAILMLAGSLATTAAFGEPAGAMPPHRYLLVKILVGMLAPLPAGYLCARLAPEGRVTVAVGLLFAIFLVAGVISGRAAASPMQPLWFQSVVTMLGASSLLVGGVVERALDAERTRREAR